ncbi:MAG TPA: substrate-binding domain-containing protein [Xanthobacteraceae bacterium]|jgi:molybdate transport system substrate-binding protein|nr:substrate-binding domain-containing protein [Xanthobacteraceae bacterium]
MPTVIKILSGNAMRTFLSEIVPLFEQSNGAKVEVEYRLTSVLKKDIEEGAAFDIALLPRPEIDELTAAGKIAEGATADVARSTVGLCVRAGAPKPDIGSVAGFKAALLAAKSISYSDGPSGAYVGGLLGQLGVADAMKPKTKLTSRPVAELVAVGEAEIGLQQIVAILPVHGADLVGPLPAELQNVIIYAAGLSARAADPKAARAFVAFTKTPQAGRIMRAKGIEPA